MKDYKIIALSSLGEELCEVIVNNCADTKTAIDEARQVFDAVGVSAKKVNVNVWFKKERK